MKTTLLITTYNRADLLDLSLNRLEQLTAPDEVLVVNDGGEEERTWEVVQRHASDLPMTYTFNNNPGPTICSLARNVGIRVAQHEWIITSEPELLFLTDVVAQFKQISQQRPSDVISAGHVFFLPPGGGLEDGMRNVTRAGDTPPPEWGVGGDYWTAPFTAMFKKDWLVEVGGWDEAFPGPWGWDDVDLLARLRHNGHLYYNAAEVVALHQFHDWGEGAAGSDAGKANKEYLEGKSYWTDRSDVVANKDGWGGLLT